MNIDSFSETLINRSKYVYMLNLIFEDELIQEIIDEYYNQGKIKDIDTLDECQTLIKPTTIYLGLVNRLKNLVI